MNSDGDCVVEGTFSLRLYNPSNLHVLPSPLLQSRFARQLPLRGSLAEFATLIHSKRQSKSSGDKVTDKQQIAAARQKAVEGGRLSIDDALALYEDNDLLFLADCARRAKERASGRSLY